MSTFKLLRLPLFILSLTLAATTWLTAQTQPPMPNYGGVLKSNDGSTLIIENAVEIVDGNPNPIGGDLTVITNQSTIAISAQDGNPIPLSGIPAGNGVGIVGTKQSDGRVLATYVIDGGPASGGGTQPPPGDGTQPPPGDGTQPPPGDGTQPPPGEGTQPPPGDGTQPPTDIQFGGKVIAVHSDRIVIETGDQDGNTISFTVYYTAGIVVDENNQPATLAPNDFISGSGTPKEDGSIQATSIIKMGSPGGGSQPPPGDGPQPGQIFTTGGEVTQVGDNFIVVSWHNPETGESGSDTHNFDASTPVVFENGNPATLAPGSHVQIEIEIQQDGNPKVLKITVFSPGGGGFKPGDKYITGGEVTQVGDNFIVVSWRNPETGESGSDTHKFDASTPVVLENGNPASLAPGSHVQIEIEIQQDGSQKVLKITVFSQGGGGFKPGDTYHRGGEITFLDAGVIVTRWENHETGESGVDTIRYTTGTPVVDQNGNPAQLEPGRGVMAEYQVREDGEHVLIRITVFTDSGPGDEGPMFHEILDGKLEGNIFTFRVVGRNEQGDQLVNFNGRLTVSTDYSSMSGQVISEETPPETLGVALNKASGGQGTLTGDWSGTLIDNGDEIPLFARFVQSNSTVTGTIQIGGEAPPGPQPGDRFQAGGEVVAIGNGFIVVSWQNPEQGTSGTDTLFFDTGFEFKDEAGNTVTLKEGDHVFGEVELQTDGKLKIVSLTVHTGGGGGFKPGDRIQAGGEVVAIGNGFIVVSWQNPEQGTSGTDTLFFDTGFEFKDEAGNTVTLKEGDHVFGEVEIQADLKRKIVSLTVHTGGGGGFKPGDRIQAGGEVVSVGDGFIAVSWQNPEQGTSGTDTLFFDTGFEFKDETGNTVTLKAGDHVFGEVEIQADLKRKIVSLTVHTGGGGGFKPGDTYQRGGEITFLGAGVIVTRWENHETGETGVDTIRYETGTPVVDQNGNPAQLALGRGVTAEYQVQENGDHRLLKITVFADSGPPDDDKPWVPVIVQVENGKLDGAVFTFGFRIELDGELKDASARLNVSADFRSLRGTVTITGQPDDSLVLNKISGDTGRLTGKWTGYAGPPQERMPLNAELLQAGVSVSGSINVGGGMEILPEGEKPEAGHQITLGGEIIRIDGDIIELSFLNKQNQSSEAWIRVVPTTRIQDLEGNALSLPLDSLLRRKVEITLVIQADFSLVANLIAISVGPSAGLPIIANGAWNAGARTVGFSLEARHFDSGLSGSIAFSGQLSADWLSLRMTGLLNGDSLRLELIRSTALAGDPSGQWTGSGLTIVNGNEKIWPVLFDLMLADGRLTGNYSIGEGRIRTGPVAQNRAPSIKEFPAVTATEGETVTVTVDATDPENDPITLSVTGTPIPGATFTDNSNGTGTYILTIPSLPAGASEIIVTFRAQDSRGAATSRVLTIKVNRLNRPPVFGVQADTVKLSEGKPLSFVIQATDPDGDPLSFDYTGLPSWASASRNVVNFQASFGTAGNYGFNARVRDGRGGEATRTFHVTVTGTNRPPSLKKIASIESPAGTAISFTVEASDPDPGDVLTYSILTVSGVAMLPDGAVFDPATRAFNWTPGASQVGPYKAGFLVTDRKGAQDKMEVNILVGQGALPPSLEAPDSLAATQGVAVRFTAGGSSNLNRRLIFHARNLPPGATFDAASRTFDWTPDFQQEGSFRTIVGVGDGSFKTEKNVTIIVNPAPRVPTLDPLGDKSVAEGQVLSFRVVGRYQDGKPVIFDEPDGLPRNATFDPVTGNFRFAPDYEQAGTYNLRFQVTGSDSEVYSVSSAVTVTNTNRSPRLGALSGVSANAGETVTIEVRATDPDADDVLTLSAPRMPQGATFNTAVSPALFTWTPTEEGSYPVTFSVTDAAGSSDQRTVYVTVGARNLPPTLGDIGELTIREGDTLDLFITVSDPDDDPVTVFVNPMPENASFDQNAKRFIFRPSYSQAGKYYIRFTASDGELTDEKTATVNVLDVPIAPALNAPRSLTVSENDLLEFTVDARDAVGRRVDVVSNNLPRGATLNPSTGAFSWRPDYEAAGQYLISFLASVGSLSSQADLTITVEDRNRPPQIFPIRNQEVREGETISFEISVSDPDGDPVTIAIDSTETPYIHSVDIRNNSVFVFNTALLDRNIQIPSAVFRVNASDGRGGTDSRAVAFKILRRDSVDVPSLPPGGDPFQHGFPGTGLTVRMRNIGGVTVSGNIAGSETSGELTAAEPETGTQLASAIDGKYRFLSESRDKVRIVPFLSAEGVLGGDFYGIRRGWGLDLSAGLGGALTGLTFEVTLAYNDEDIPARDIPEFTEAAISAFGLDTDGNFVQLATVLDTVNNKATFTADLSRYTDYTLGVILDLEAPYITSVLQLANTTDELGPYEVTAVVVDNVMVRDVKLFYALEGGQFSSVSMTPVSGQMNLYSGKIPGQAEGSTVTYYVQASDSLHTVTNPENAPAGTYRFSILIDGVSQVTPGDVDGNGKIDIFDLLSLLRVLGGTSPASPASDVDGNGRTDIFDLLALLRKLGE